MTKLGENRQGRRFGGRQKGTPNKVTKAVKEAIIMAADAAGEDGKGKGGVVGYLKHLAITQPVAFAGLLGRIIPTEVKAAGGMTHSFVARIPLPIETTEEWLAKRAPKLRVQ